MAEEKARPAITGIVVDAKGQPVPEAVIRARSRPLESGRFPDIPTEEVLISYAIADANGRFTLEAPRDGRWRIAAVPEPDAEETSTVATTEPGGRVRVTIKLGPPPSVEQHILREMDRDTALEAQVVSQVRVIRKRREKPPQEKR